MHDISNKIISIFGGTDKLLHFLCGALIVAQFEVFEWYMPLIGLAVATLLGLIKELLDKDFDFNDLIMTMIGGFVELWSLTLRLWFFGDEPWGGF